MQIREQLIMIWYVYSIQHNTDGTWGYIDLDGSEYFLPAWEGLTNSVDLSASLSVRFGHPILLRTA